MSSSQWQNEPLYRRLKEDYHTYSPFITELSNTSSAEKTSIQTLSLFYFIVNDSQLLNCFLHLPVQDSLPFRVDFKTIVEAQLQDAELTQLKQTKPQQYVLHTFAEDTQVCCILKDANAALKIYLPIQMIQSTIQWYHAALSHPGSTRLKDTLRIHFHNPKLSNAIEDFTSNCNTCQRQKAVGQGHGHTAPKEAPLIPWQHVAVDLLGHSWWQDKRLNFEH